MTVEREAIIGLEVHAQIATATKMFCGCSADSFGAAPNTAVCPICMGFPGTLPVPNAAAVEKAVRAALAIGCTVRPTCHFDRKHYFYPDLPAGYQISQYDFPLAEHGEIFYPHGGGERRCRIRRLHLENDAGKLTHRGTKALCDYNRAGVALMEIVTEPDLRTPEEAVKFAEELRRILIAVSASDADMYKGMLRFDASISLRERGTEALNPRSEIKNLNSFKALQAALAYEAERLEELWRKEGGPLPGNITVGWMDDEARTRMLRDKETADDYRYFPEPDIPPLVFTAEAIAAARAALPELPGRKRDAYATSGLSPAEIALLTANPSLAALFDAVNRGIANPKRAASVVLTQLLGFLNAVGKDVGEGPTAEAIVALLRMVDVGSLSAHASKEVLADMVRSGMDAEAVIRKRGLGKGTDAAPLDGIIAGAIAANPAAVASFQGGKAQALGAIVGWVMKETRGNADPKIVSEKLRKILGR